MSIGFYQNKRYSWFLTKLQKDFKCGSIRTKTDDVVEYVITAADPVRNLLLTTQRFSGPEKTTSQFSFRNFGTKETNSIKIGFSRSLSINR